jgi:SAM-dependent methyltransferase
VIQIPKLIKFVLRLVYRIFQLVLYKVMDVFDILKGDKNPLIPPRSMIFIGDGDYKKTGDEFLNYFIELAGLKQSHKVLDIGCGIGRMSVPLTKYLSIDGEYYGFDIVKKGIEWCNENISSVYSNFHYEHSDIYNKMYNNKGVVQSSAYIFRYNDEFFNFVFLTSVFTHMHTKDVKHYISEISRVMKVGSRCLITFFLLNKESNQLIKESLSTQNLIYQIDDNSFTKDKNVPESALGFREEFIREEFSCNNLKIKKPIYYGSWCGRNKYKSYQDIIIAEKI